MRWLVTARLLTVLAGVSAGYGAYVVASATGDRSWPTVDGKALSSRFTGIISPAPPAKYASASRGGILERWAVTYEYVVDGERHRGEATAAYRPMSEVTVYYDPSDPRRSVLQPGIDFVVVAYSILLSTVLFLASRFAHGAAGSA